MMAAIATAALMGAGPVTAFAQAAESEATSSSDVLAGQVLSELLFDNDAAQTSETPETNALDDADAATVTRTNAPVQTQEEPIAADVEAEGLTVIELLALIEGLPAGGAME